VLSVSSVVIHISAIPKSPRPSRKTHLRREPGAAGIDGEIVFADLVAEGQVDGGRFWRAWAKFGVGGFHFAEEQRGRSRNSGRCLRVEIGSAGSIRSRRRTIDAHRQRVVERRRRR